MTSIIATPRGSLGRLPRRLAVLVLAALAMVPVAAPAALGAGPPIAAISSITDEGADGLWRLDAHGWPGAPAVDGTSWILVDVTTGQILEGHAEGVARPPASTTKLLTALAVVRRTEPGDVVTVGAQVVGLEGASAGLREGDQLTVDDLLALLLLRSGNDAAEALAVHTAGSLEAFARLLRDEAAVLGLQDAVVSEPHGLYDLNRLSARALAVIGRAVLTEPRLRPLVGASSWRLASGQVITNRNELLAAYPGATGLKTGQTRAAGWSLVASARRGQRHLVAVVLGGQTADGRFTSAGALLDHGFDAFARPPAVPELRVRGNGTWLSVVSPRQDALLPNGTVPTLVPALPVEPEAPTLQWNWTTPSGAGAWRSSTRFSVGAVDPGTAPLAQPVSRAVGGTSASTEGTAVLGAWLSGRLQAGMRAATVANLWR